MAKATRSRFSAEELQQPVGLRSRRSATLGNPQLGWFFFNCLTAHKLHSGIFTVVINSFYGFQFLESFKQSPRLPLLPVTYRRSCETAAAAADPGQPAFPSHAPGAGGYH